MGLEVCWLRNVGIRSEVYLKVKGRGQVTELVAVTLLSESFFLHPTINHPPFAHPCADRNSGSESASLHLRMEVQVYGHGGHLCDVHLQHPEAIVGELQWAIQETTDIGVIEQRLFVGTTELLAGERLSYHRGLSLSPSPRLRVALIRRPAVQARWLLRVLHGQLPLTELADAPSEIRGDKDVVLAAVHRDGHALRWSSQELRRDKEVVLEALQQTPWALQHAAPELQSDKEVVMTAVAACGRCMQWASVELRADREVALAAARSPTQNTLKWCEYHLADREVVLETVRKNGYDLGLADVTLRGDREVVQTALGQDGMALEFASPELRADRDLALQAVQMEGQALQFAAEPLRADKALVLAAVQNDAWGLQFAPPHLQADREVVLKAIQQGATPGLRWAAPQLRADKTVVLAVAAASIEQQDCAWPAYVAPALQDDEEVIAAKWWLTT